MIWVIECLEVVHHLHLVAVTRAKALIEQNEPMVCGSWTFLWWYNVSAQRTHRPSPHFRHKKITGGYGFLQGWHNVHGWDRSQHEQLLQIENTQYLRLQQCCSTSTRREKQPGKRTSWSGQAVPGIWTAWDEWMECEVVSLSLFSFEHLAN